MPGVPGPYREEQHASTDLMILTLWGQGRIDDGLALLIERYGSIVKAVIQKKYVVNDSRLDAQEVLCEAVTLFWKRFKSYDPAQGRILPWLVTIATHVACDQLREFSKLPSLLGEQIYDRSVPPDQLEPDQSLDGVASRPDLKMLLMDAISSDPSPIQRQILHSELARGQKVPTDELARELEKSADTIRVYRSRALRRLRKVLESTDRYFAILGGHHD